MKKTKIVMGIGSIVLASAAFLAAKPAKVLQNFTAGFANIGAGGSSVSIILTNTHFTDVSAVGRKTALLKTSGNSKIATLVTSTAFTNKVYFKP